VKMMAKGKQYLSAALNRAFTGANPAL
jgi:hypothetical protein